MRLSSHPFFFFIPRSLFCSSSAICFVSLGMSPFDFFFKKKKKKEEEERHAILGRRQGEQGWLEDGARLLKEIISSCDGRGCYPIRMFSAKEIQQAIGERFSDDVIEKVLAGTHEVFEGTHEDRQIIIKVYRIEERERNVICGIDEREMAFNEVATVTQIKHANVAKLLGCCFEMEQPILIYEKVPFILSNLLFEANPPSSSPISWDHRLRIAIEIAYAITYLHIGTSRPIVHRDINCSNILLDEHFKPKLTDFSLSRTIPFGKTHVAAGALLGAFAYMAPEYACFGIVSEKSDVYSYGVVLLELLSGQRRFAGDIDNETLNKLLWTNESTEKEERLELILHNGLSMDVRQVEQAMACIEVAVGCTLENPAKRPAMKEVTQQLMQIERGELPLSSSLLRVQQLATVGSSEGFSQIRTQYERESGSSEGVSPR
ncbi:wall-associated receptor kinase-like protein 2 [Cinnamomum micranthum f. kanehirae]|uniref:Wall-associated receptor kinase-like protein 2 n=1 Tax=Cinnamomum micranthum f. kanehirae TaxID=337451 RepID=A0A3S4NPB6_9MAGN|nr:wall-associated receptor kinase-like protein 2 [Cinnamomum micranthum f. kanehirae]